MIDSTKVSVGWERLDAINSADIVSVKTPNDFMSKATRIAQRRAFEDKSWASHTGIVTDKHFNKITINEALWRVEERDLTVYKNKSQVAITRFPLDDLVLKYKILDDVRSRIGKKYGWWKLFEHLLGRKENIENVDRPICSYHVAEAFARSNIYFLGLPASYVQPDDILDHCMYNFEDSLVWVDSHKTLDELVEIYNTDDYVGELKDKYLQ